MSLRIKNTAGKKTGPDGFDPEELYKRLFLWYGPSKWWPGDSPFEIAVGAVLTQNTAWTNVEKAIGNLKAAGMLDINKVYEKDAADLASLIRPSGYYNIKARRLKNLVCMIMDGFSGDLNAFFDQDRDSLRAHLLSVNGIGKETADSICCYSADKRVFVVDAYTRRILVRHGVIDEDWGYDDIQAIFEAGLPPELQVYKDLHAHIVFIGKDFCRTRNPLCHACPLNSWMGRTSTAWLA